MKAQCCICGDDAKIVKKHHWSTGLEVDLVEGTCGRPECLSVYEEGMQEGFRLAEEEFEFRKMMEEIDNAKA